MRILLPPSEAKTPGGTGKSLQARKATGSLDAARAPVFHALAALLRAADPAAAARALILPESIAGEAMQVNARVRISGTRPALDRYSGVVYDGLAAHQLSRGARTTAAKAVLVFSGLLGAVRGADPVPNYRVPAKATLPGVGVAGTYWRPKLSALLPPLLGDGLIVDLRSSDYLSMWQPSRQDPLYERILSVRILSPKPSGALAVISYPSKYHKGRLAAALLEHVAAGNPIRTASDVADVWLSVGGKDARLGSATKSGLSATLELITLTSKIV
ncbi:peroxide stress protein YaaA [Jatrophihabitans sp. DSM 45814]